MNNCLNVNSPNVQNWASNEGLTKAYEVYVDNNFVLPNYSVWKQYNTEVSQSVYTQLLNKILPINSFGIKPLSDLFGTIPVETQAAYLNGIMYLTEKPKLTEVYEEAFHAIFDTLVTSDEKKSVLSAAQSIMASRLRKENKTINDYINELVEKYPLTYASMSKKERLDRAFEEEVAKLYVDSLQYNNPYGAEKQLEVKLIPYLGSTLASVISRLLNRIFSTLKSISKLFSNNQDTISTLFNNINNGTYKTYVQQESNVTIPTTRLLELNSELEYDDLIKEYFSSKTEYTSEETQKVIRNAGSIFFQLQNEEFSRSIDDTIDKALIIYFDLSNVNVYKDGSLLNDANKEPIDALKTDIKNYIKDFNSLIDFDDVNVESEEGVQQDFANFELGADEKSSYESSFSKQLKLRLAKTGIQISHGVYDINGKEVRINLVQAIDVPLTYYSIARALSNTGSIEDRWNKLMAFSNSETNLDAKAFVNQLLQDMFPNQDLGEVIKNIGSRKDKYVIFPRDETEYSKVIGTNNSVIVNSIMKGFDLWRRNNFILTVDINQNNKGLVEAKLYDANIGNVQASQFNTWIDTINDLINKNNKLENPLNIFKKIPSLDVENAGEIEGVTNKVHLAFAENGIQLSKDYVRYSVEKEYKNFDPKYSSTLLDTFKIPEDQLLTSSIITKQINLAFNNLKVNNYNIDYISSFRLGIKGKLQNIAKGNSILDERITDSNYKAADGKTVFGYQWKTFHLQRVDEILRDPSKFQNTIPGQELENGEIFIGNNYLLDKLNNDDKYKSALKKGIISTFSAAGLRQSNSRFGSEGEAIANDESDGVVAGDMSNRDFMLYVLNATVSCPTFSAGFAPVYFGNYESSKTYEFINLPIIEDLVGEDGNISNKAVELYTKEIQKEYRRIIKESNSTKKDLFTKYNTGKTVTITVGNNSFKIPYKVDGLTNKKVVDFSNYRSLTFSDYVNGIINIDIPTAFNDLLNQEDNQVEESIIMKFAKGNLQISALFGLPFDAESIASEIKDNVNEMNNNVITFLEEGGELLDNRYNTSSITEFIEGDKIGNIKKILTSLHLNTMYANQIMQGDQALLFKNDMVDMFKRFKGRNASINSFETNTIAPELGITKLWKKLKYVVHKEVVQKSGIDLEEIETANAQNYTTVNYMRYAAYAMGRLSKDLAQLYDMIQQGEDTSFMDSKIFEMDLFTAILKTVHFDGSNYLKKSDMMLSKRLTSNFKELNITEKDALVYLNKIVRTKANPRLNQKEVATYEPKPGATKEIVRWSNGKFYEVVPLYPNIENELHDRRKVMEGWEYKGNGDWEYIGNDAEVMLSMPITASKMLNKNVLESTDLRTIKSENINELDLKYYGLQVETAHPHDKIPDPTQYLEIALNELVDDKTKSFTINGEKITFNELINKHQSLQYQRDVIRFDELYSEIFNEKGEFDKETFRMLFVKSLEVSGNERQVLELATDGQFNHPLIRDKYIAQLLSFFTKDGLSQKRKGDAAPHFSSYGMKFLKQAVKVGNTWTWRSIETHSEEWERVINDKSKSLEGLDFTDFDYYPDPIEGVSKNSQRPGYNRLQDRLESLGEEGYFIDGLRHLKPRFDNNGVITGHFTEMVLSKYDVNQKSISEKEKYMFGVRIPSQDKHSGVNAEWIDRLPAHYGSAVSVAKEIVQLSGHDFDIDKLYISKIEGYYKDKTFIPYDNSYDSFIYYQFKNNKPTKELFKKLKEDSEKYQGLKDQIDEIKLFKQEAYKYFEEVKENLIEQIDGLTESNIKDVRKYLRIDEINNELYDVVNKSKDDIKQLKSELKSLNKSQSIIKLVISNSLSTYLKDNFEDYYSVLNSANNKRDSIIVSLEAETELITNKVIDELLLSEEAYNKEYKDKYSNRGVINNILLEINQQGLSNLQTLDGGSADIPASLTGMVSGVLKENPLDVIDSNIDSNNVDSELTEKQNESIEELKLIEPAYAGYSNKQIHDFINSKFPDSQVKEVLLHGTPKYSKSNAYKLLKLSQELSNGNITEEEFNIESEKLKTKILSFDKTRVGNNSNIISKEGFFFTNNKNVALYSDSNDLYPVIINAKNPIVQNKNGQKIDLTELDESIKNRKSSEPEFLYLSDQNVWEKEIKDGRILDTQEPVEGLSEPNSQVFENQKFKKDSVEEDSIILENVIDSLEKEEDKLGNTYIVFEPSQVIILNSPETIEEFKKFVNRVDTVESLRSDEQSELQKTFPSAEPIDGKIQKESLNSEEDISKFETIYNKYDKLITPLLNKEKSKETESIVSQIKYLLSDNGKTYVDQNKTNYNVHHLLGHANYHKNTTTGKKNIGVDVNWLLLNIVMNRLDVEININNNVTIGNITYDKFKLNVGSTDLRVFDIISTLISSATDEAKEQLNARYGLTIDALNAVLPFIAMGGSLSQAIALVNQPLVKEYLKLKSKKDNAILTESESQDAYMSKNDMIQKVFLNNDIKIDIYSDLYKEIINDLVSYDNNDLALGLRKKIDNPDKSVKMFNDFIKLSEITEYGTNIIALIKLKKGLGSDIYSFDELLSRISKLQLDVKDEEFDKDTPLNFRKAFKDNEKGRAQEFKGKLGIVDKLSKSLPKLINLKSKIFETLRNNISNNSVFLGKTGQQELNNELESYIYSQLFYQEINQLEDDSYDKTILKYLDTSLIDANSPQNIEVIFNEFILAASNFTNLKDNLIINKLKIKKDKGVVSLSINQLKKLTDTEATGLIDSFVYLTKYVEPLPGTISPLEFTKMLQALYIIKDGMQFKYDGISKIFPKEVFSRMKGILDRVSDDRNININEREFTKRYFESVKHSASTITKTYKNSSKEDSNFLFKPGAKNQLSVAIISPDLKNENKPLNDSGQPLAYVRMKITTKVKEKEKSKTYLMKFISKESNGNLIYEEVNKTGSSNVTTMGTPIGQLVFGEKFQNSNPLISSEEEPFTEKDYDLAVIISIAKDIKIMVDNLVEHNSKTYDEFVLEMDRYLKNTELSFNIVSGIKKARQYAISKVELNNENDKKVTKGIEVISESYGVIKNSNELSKEEETKFINILKPFIESQAYQENKTGNKQFSFGKMWSRVNIKAIPLLIDSFAGKSKVISEINKLLGLGKNKSETFIYDYHKLDQNGNELPTLNNLKPITEYLEKSLNIDLSEYDSVLGNIYEGNESLYAHKDTTEDKRNRKYGIFTVVLGNTTGLGIRTDNNGKMTFAYRTPEGQTMSEEMILKSGNTYGFGVEGKGRFELTHATPVHTGRNIKFPPVTLSDGRIIENYTITLTYRKAEYSEGQKNTTISSELNSNNNNLTQNESQEQDNEIYNKLGNKTSSANVMVEPNFRSSQDMHKKGEAIYSMRPNFELKSPLVTVDKINNFGNPFSSVPDEIAKGLIATKSIKESVEKYIDWVINSSKVENFTGFWKRDDVAKQTDKVFLFGDNTDDRINTKYIPSSTQAVIRGLTNAIGIDTKKDRETRKGTQVTPNLSDVLQKLNDLPYNDKPMVTFSFSGRESTKSVFESLTKEGNNYKLVSNRYIVLINDDFEVLSTTNKETGKTFKYSNDKIGESTIEINSKLLDPVFDTTKPSYFTDEDFPQFKQQVDEAIQKAKDSGKIIVIPADGIGTGKSMLKEKAPKLFDYLQQQLDMLKRAEWVREQIKSGALKGKKIVYYKELNEPSHATALDYLINNNDLNTSSSENEPSQDTNNTQQQDPNDKFNARNSKSNVLFNSNDKELKKGSFVEYKGVEYLFWNNNDGKAQLISTDGTKFIGTPNIDKLKVLGSYKTTFYNKTEYIVTDNDNLYSGSTGILAFAGSDNSSIVVKKNIINNFNKSLNNGNGSQNVSNVPYITIMKSPGYSDEYYDYIDSDGNVLGYISDRIVGKGRVDFFREIIKKAGIPDSVVKQFTSETFGIDYSRVFSTLKPMNNSPLNDQNSNNLLNESNFVFPDNHKIQTDFPLTKDQKNTLTELYKWYVEKKPDNEPVDERFDKTFLIQGNAGSGKSSAIKYFLQYLVETNRLNKTQIALSSPTHKANKVLFKFVKTLKVKDKSLFKGDKNEYSEQVFTTQAAFGVRINIDKRKGYTHTDSKFKNKGYAKLSDKKIWVIDEISMINEVNERGFESILDAFQFYQSEGISIILMGDDKQLTNPSVGKVSPLFTVLPNKYILKEEVRQSLDNPLLNVLSAIKDVLDKKIKVVGLFEEDINDVNDKNEGYVFEESLSKESLALFSSEEYQKDRSYTKIITRSNNSVKKFNNTVRNSIFKNPRRLEVNDTLMGYEQFGASKISKLYNGQEYIVKEVDLDFEFSLKQKLTEELKFLKTNYRTEIAELISGLSDENLLGDRVILNEDNPLFIPEDMEIFMVNTNTSLQLDKAKPFVEDYEKITREYHKQNDLMKTVTKSSPQYFSVLRKKDTAQALLGMILNIIQLPSPLYKNVSTHQAISEEDMISSIKQEYSEKKIKINFDQYFSDVTKNRLFVDKTIDFGYAITVNKSQGSTYQYPIVDLKSIEGKNNYWYTKDNENTWRNLYVSLSRTSKKLTLINSKNNSGGISMESFDDEEFDNMTYEQLGDTSFDISECFNSDNI